MRGADARSEQTPGSTARKPTIPRPDWPTTFSPQVFLNRSLERLNASPTPTSSSTRIGTVRKVTRFHARPTSRATMRADDPEPLLDRLRMMRHRRGDDRPRQQPVEPRSWRCRARRARWSRCRAAAGRRRRRGRRGSRSARTPARGSRRRSGPSRWAAASRWSPCCRCRASATRPPNTANTSSDPSEREHREPRERLVGLEDRPRALGDLPRGLESSHASSIDDPATAVKSRMGAASGDVSGACPTARDPATAPAGARSRRRE